MNCRPIAEQHLLLLRLHSLPWQLMQVCPNLCGMHTNLYRGGAASAISSQATIRLQSHNRTSSATAAQAQQDPGGYIGTDGRRKATFEEAWSLKHPPGDQHLPWRMSWQRNEKDLKFTDQTRAHLVQVFAARHCHTRSSPV